MSFARPSRLVRRLMVSPKGVYQRINMALSPILYCMIPPQTLISPTSRGLYLIESGACLALRENQ